MKGVYERLFLQVLRGECEDVVRTSNGTGTNEKELEDENVNMDAWA